MQNAVAFSNNDVVTIAWSYGARPEGCMGFAVYRIDSKGKETALPSHAVFEGDTIKPGQTTEEFPVQKFYWKDPYARLIADSNGSRAFRYKIVPLQGKPDALTPMKNLPSVISNEVTVTSEVAKGTNAVFNRGLISTQRVARALKGKADAGSLKTQIADPKSPLRQSLAGDMVATLTGFLDRAKISGTIYASLYELNDEQLIGKLEALGKRLQIVLSNSVGAEDPETGAKPDENEPARRRLAKTAAVKWDRIMPENHIGHNKFAVYVDSANKAQAVLFGSTNWTFTGLCAQTNNTMVVEDPKLADRYWSYWKQLAADTKSANGTSKDLQGPALRTWDATDKSLTLVSGDAAESWFSPNTPKARTTATKKETAPPDMDALMKRISAAKEAILFLAFFPGAPGIPDWAADAQSKNRDLFVRGCVTNPSAAEGFYYELKGMTPPKKVKGEKNPLMEDPRVIAAEAFDGKDIPTGWQKEILKAGFAVVHDKIVVIDPFADDCVVVTGSHNLGYKASFDNDENLVIVEGDKKLAVAYATHVLDVYDHFAWRYQVKRLGPKGADQSLKGTPDEWLDQYFDANGQIKTAQLKFWMQATT